MNFLFIHWNVNPEVIDGWNTPRWYGLLFALGFIIGYRIVQKMFKAEGVPEKWLDQLLLYVMIATVVGARLGHVFFYDWEYYSQHLGEIPQIWKGGLASHGGAIGIIIALALYSKWVSKKSILWILDRVVVPIALAGVCIRLGNLMNSEIVGKPTDLPWGFIFERYPGDETPIPRHPAQLYESFAYLLIFVLLYYMYWKTKAKEYSGLIFGTFLAILFTARFVIEFFKAGQADRDAELAINTGQILSIPLVLVGIYFIIRNIGFFKGRSPKEAEDKSERG